MSDQDYLAKYIIALQTLTSVVREDLVYVKDSNDHFHFVSNGLEYLLADKPAVDQLDALAPTQLSYSQLINPSTLRSNLQSTAPNLSPRRRMYLQRLNCGNEMAVFLMQNDPIVNPSKGNLVGIHGRLYPLYWLHAAKVLFKMHEVDGLWLDNNQGRNPLVEFPLNNMQHIVLFLCVHNCSYSEIALIMNEFGYSITSARVNDYLEQLKLIFHVRSKGQLIEKALSLDFHLLFPEGLFANFTTLEVGSDLARIVKPKDA